MANPDVERRIQNYPLKTVKVRGVSFLVRVDPETNEGYIMEEDGNTWTGKKAKLGKPPESPGVDKKESAAAPSEDDKGDKDSGKKRWGKKESAPAEKKKRPEKEKKPARSSNKSDEDDPEAKKKKALIVIAVAAIAIVGIFILLSSGILGGGNGGVGNNGGVQTSDEPLETANVAQLAVAENYDVLIVTRNMYPGDVITEADLGSFTINKVEYAQCGGAYPVSCKGNVVGMQMKKFLPFGALLDYDSCTAGVDYTVAPWNTLDDDHVYVDIPYVVDIYQNDSYIPGDYVRLTISRDTKSNTSGTTENDTTGEMGHTSQTSASITTDVFTFDSIQITDFLTENRQSLYATYSRYLTVPEGYLASAIGNEITRENFSNVEIHYMRIIVTKEQANVIGSLPDDATRVEMSVVRSAPEIDIPGYNSKVSAINNLLVNRYQQIQQEENN